MLTNRNKLLITTSIEETWGINDEIVFLGEWCLLFDKKNHWDNLNYKVVPYHWNDRSKLEKDYIILINLFENLLSELVIILNKLHNINLSQRAWRIILGPWLGFFIQICYDRWCMIEKAVNMYDNLNTIILDFEDNYSFVPNDMSSFINDFANDRWNHFIYSQIVSEFNIKTIKKKSTLVKKKNNTNSLFFNLKFSIKYHYNIFANIINGEDAFFSYNTYLNFRDRVKLSLNFKQIPIFPVMMKSKSYNIDNASRSWVFNEKLEDTSFVNFVKKIIPQQIPRSYIEGFQDIYLNTSRTIFPKKPIAIFTTNSLYTDEYFKFYAAIKIDAGSKLLIGQHGGHYGIGKLFFNEYHELKISDTFFSWGWTDSINSSRIYPLGMISNKSKKKLDYKSNKKILYVTTTVPRYSYSIHSLFISSQWLNYFNSHLEFVSNINFNLRENLIIRCFKNDFNWSQIKRWKEVYPNLCYNNGEDKIEALTKKCKLYVSTYNATTFLESLSMNIPTIIYWDINFGELRDSALPYFDLLFKVKIFHKDAKSAAEHINNVWDNIEFWWEDELTQEALCKFISNYCSNNSMLSNSISDFVKGVN